MNIQLKTTIAALGAMLFCAAPAVANAERVYFLVGTRHVFRIGTYQYAHVDERQKIEQDYADQIAADQDIYKKALADGANPDEEGANLNAALDDLANERDKELGAIYENADYERVRHPELQIVGDGPYQVMSIHFHWRGDIEVFDDFCVYAPWPGYYVVERPYGWSYGVVYSPYEFHHCYTTWYGGYVAIGRPAFVGIVGYSGAVSFSIGFGGGGGDGRAVFVRRHGVRPEGWEHSAYHATGTLHERTAIIHDRTVNRVIGNGGSDRFHNDNSRNGGQAGSRYSHTTVPGSSGSRYNRGDSNPGSTGNRYNRGDSNPGSTGNRYNRGDSNSGSTGYRNNRGDSTSGSTGYRGNRGDSTSGSTGSRYHSGGNPSSGSNGSGGSRYSHSTSGSDSSRRPSHSDNHSKGDNKDKGKGG